MLQKKPNPMAAQNAVAVEYNDNVFRGNLSGFWLAKQGNLPPFCVCLLT